MIEFILNNQSVSTYESEGLPILDFIRLNQHLKGTKIGCREGDCGACTILVGDIVDDIVVYKSITSCLTPLLNVHGKHVVTVEGLNFQDNQLNIVQEKMIKHNASQCGFCTPGFVVSMMSEILPNNIDKSSYSIDGNICRCTGYKSIEKAYNETKVAISESLCDNAKITKIVNKNIVPSYFSSIHERLQSITPIETGNGGIIMGGGTDLLVQKAHVVLNSDLVKISEQKEILLHDNIFTIGASVTPSDMLSSSLLKAYFPNLLKHLKLISSTPIRNIGTLGGNIVNASPIGDLTIFLLALDATVNIKDSLKNQRSIKLSEFYKAYKVFDLNNNEHIDSFQFEFQKDTFFNFEKVSKRTHLDIASVNSAISINIKENIIQSCHLSAGGIGPVPTYLGNTVNYLVGKRINTTIIIEASEILLKEISPISDIRGSSRYKSLLLKQLFLSHFVELFPTLDLSPFQYLD